MYILNNLPNHMPIQCETHRFLQTHLINNDSCLLGVDSLPGMLHILTYSILTISLWDEYYSFYYYFILFKNKETKYSSQS